MATTNSFSDHDLIILLGEGNHVAYTEIYERYFGLLYLHARRKIKEPEEARDIVQEIFISLWNNRQKIDAERGIKPYLYAALKNKIIDWIAHQDVTSKYITSFKMFRETEHCITDHRVRENQLTALIEKEIQALPPRMREIFELSRKAHLNHREIAEVLGISEQTVKTQVKNALRILRVRLGILLYLLLLTQL